MATRASVNPGLTEAIVREQVASAHHNSRPLPFVVFEARSDEGAAWRALACILRCRAGGFMVVLPHLEEIMTWCSFGPEHGCRGADGNISWPGFQHSFCHFGRLSMGALDLFPPNTTQQIFRTDWHPSIQAAGHSTEAQCSFGYGSCGALDQQPINGRSPISGIRDSCRGGGSRRWSGRSGACGNLRRCRPSGSDGYHPATAGSAFGTRVQGFDGSVKSCSTSPLEELVQHPTTWQFEHCYVGQAPSSRRTSSSSFGKIRSWGPGGTAKTHISSGQLLGGRGGGRSNRQGRVYIPCSHYDRPHAEVDGLAVEAKSGPVDSHSSKATGLHHFSFVRDGQRRRQLQHRRARLHSSGSLSETGGGSFNGGQVCDAKRDERHGSGRSLSRADAGLSGTSSATGGDEAADSLRLLHGPCVGNSVHSPGRDVPWLCFQRPHDGRTSGDGCWQDTDGLAFDWLAGAQLGFGKSKSEEAGHPAFCKVMPAIVDSCQRGLLERPGLLGEQNEEFRSQIGEGSTVNCRQRETRQEGQETMAKSKGQGRSRRRRRHLVLSQSMNHGLSGTMSSTSGTADRCFTSRVETDDSFAKDVSFFDACGSSHNLKGRSFCDSVDSPNNCDRPPLNFCADSPDTFSFLDILDRCMQTNMKVHVGLRDFILLSCEPATRTAQSGAQCSRDLMPCPPPLWRWTGSQRPSPKQRRKKRFLKLIHRIVQQVICTLNWEALGHVVKPPPAACAGFCISPDQHLMIERIESMILRFATAGSFEASTLGRSADKLERLFVACQELPGAAQDVDLLDVVNSVRQGLDPYGSNSSSKPPKNPEAFCPKAQQTVEHASVDFCASPDPGSKIHLDSSTCKPVIADRIKWEHSPNFDPRPFLTDPVVKAAFDNPETLRLPPECWIKKPCGRVHCNRKEVLKLAKKWDEKGALKIFQCSEVNHDEAVGIFAVGKDATWDRLILNPVVINGRMKSYSNYTKSLAPGCLVGLVQLAPDEVLRISADDLAEMYYTFMVPDERAKRNCIRMKFSPRELSQFSSFNPAEHTSSCYLALGALAMGDSLAVEIAQQAHFQVLVQLAGSLRDSERVAYRKPFPRGKFYEFLAIDDHLGLQVVSRADFASGVRARDSEVFERAGAAYRKVGLVQHPKKKKRGVTQGTFLGAEVDGIEGKVSAPRHRAGLLMMCTSIVAAKGFVTPKLLSAILGSWISVLMFRRPIMSVMQSVFSEGSGKKQDEIFELSRQSRNELLALSILGPLAQTDLRTQTCPKIFCMDASPHGSGICQVDEDANVVTELWRHSEQKGFYTRLSNPAASILEELGLPSEAVFGANIEPVHTSVNFPPPRSLREGFIFDCIELFKGEGNWSIAHSSVHLKVHPGLDVHGRRVAYVDMMDPAAFAEITALAYRGVIREWHAGPPCFTFGTLRRPRIRNKAQPWGFNSKDPLTIEQNSLARRTAFLLCIALLQGCFISVEQPGSSVMFYMHAFKVLAMLGCVFSRFCFCTYGAAFKKPSKWLHNKPWLLELESKCQCKSPSDHFIIQGNFTRDNVKDFEAKCRPSSVEVYGRAPRVGESVASYSASYPIPLCRRMALGSLAHKNGQSPIIPLSRKMQTLKELSLSEAEPSGSEPTNIPAWRSWHEDPDWIGELADCLHFSELLRYKFRKTGHINVLECRTYKTWLKHCARCHPNSRLVALLDSRVTLGAAAKGRSSSFALSRVLQGSLGYVLGGGLYPGGLHVESEKNRSDGPSRNRPVPAPTKDSPGWLVALRKGNYDPFDAVLSSAFFARGPGRWVRLLILLCGDVERNPGPFSDNMRCRHDRVPRGPLDSTVGFATATATRMDHCLHAFRLWISEHLQTTFDALAENPHTMALSLRGYGLFLYEQGYPRYLLVYAITAVQDRLPHFRGFMAPAWQVDRKWQQAEPGECRPVISGPILCAAISVAAMWGWHFWIGVSMIGFLGMLHPAEFLNLCRQDLVLPKDALVDQQIAYVHLRNPKTSRFARRQHAKIEDPFAVKYLEALYGSRPLSFKLFPGTVTVYRRQWDAIMDRLEVPHSRQTRGATPATLRGSGATHLYLATEDIQLIAWRGRWTKVKTIEFYLQEVAAQLILHHLSASAKTRIQLLASWVTSLLESAMASFQWNTPSN